MYLQSPIKHQIKGGCSNEEVKCENAKKDSKMIKVSQSTAMTNKIKNT